MDTHELARFLLARPAQPIDCRETPEDRERWTVPLEISRRGHQTRWLQVGLLSNDPDEAIDQAVRFEQWA